MTTDQYNKCRATFEANALDLGERAHLDQDGFYKNILHRSRWVQWLTAWECCMQNCNPELDGAPVIESSGSKHDSRRMESPGRRQSQPRAVSSHEGLHNFLKTCRISGIFFDGTDAVGNQGVYFIDEKLLRSHMPADRQE